jgi:hypothetical protein
LTRVLDELPYCQPIAIHRRYGNILANRRNAQEGGLVRAAHGEPCSHFVTFGNHLFERPLDVGETASHHSNDFEILSGILQRLGASRSLNDDR